MDKIKSIFIKRQTYLLIFVILIASFVRLYRISEYMTFLGDEGRDVVVVRRLLVNRDLIFVGPTTSIGNMYLGPLYYYLMAPFLLIFNFNPVGPAVMVAIFGVLTVFLIYKILEKATNQTIALLTALLYALSPTVINLSRHSWNPNIMPFFSLLLIYSVWQFWNLKNFKWLIVTGVSFAFAIQSHYMGLLLLPVITVCLLFTLLSSFVDKTKIKSLLLYFLLSTFCFLSLMFPLFLFDYKYDFRNFYAMKDFLFSSGGGEKANYFLKFFENINTITFSLFSAKIRFIHPIILLGILTSGIYVFLYKKVKYQEKLIPWVSLVVFVLLTGVFGLGFIKRELFDHYFGFLFPVMFLFLGFLFSLLPKWVSYMLYVILYTIYIWTSPLKQSPNMQVQRTKLVIESIIQKSNGVKFNYAVIADNNYEGAYQYYLELNHANFIDIDNQKTNTTITNQLYVICEKPENECKPTTNSKAQIAHFGWSRIEEHWQVWGVNIYKLGHFNEK